MIPHSYPAISRSSILELCELLGLDGGDVGSMTITPESVIVTGRPGTRPLLLPIIADV